MFFAHKKFSSPLGQYVFDGLYQGALILTTSNGDNDSWFFNGASETESYTTVNGTVINRIADYGFGIWNKTTIYFAGHYAQQHTAGTYGYPYGGSSIGGDYADYGSGAGPQETLLKLWNHGDGTAGIRSGQVESNYIIATYTGTSGGREEWSFNGRALVVETDGSIIYLDFVGSSQRWYRLNALTNSSETPTSATVTSPVDGETRYWSDSSAIHWFTDSGDDRADVYVDGSLYASGVRPGDVNLNVGGGGTASADILVKVASGTVTSNDVTFTLTDPAVPGCTDPIACNYNSGATVDDGSCCYVTGCTDPGAFNFDPLACCDDGSCCYSGCVDPVATNYCPSCCNDDGSCTY